MRQHLRDLASDFSAIHRVDDMGAMPSAAFFALASRLPAYEGAMRATLLEQRGADVPATKAALQASPEMAGMFSFGGGWCPDA